MEKKGALELSIGTIVIIVLAMSMLILGLVLVRTIMCGAVGLTGEMNNKIRGEINKLFQTTAGEVVCIGSGQEPVTIGPGEIAIIWCAVDAPKVSEYNIKVKGLSADVLKETELEDWIIGDDFWKGNVAPGDTIPKKALRLNVPQNAPDDLVTVDVEIYRDNELISTQQLDFQVRETGFFKAAVC